MAELATVTPPKALDLFRDICRINLGKLSGSEQPCLLLRPLEEVVLVAGAVTWHPASQGSVRQKSWRQDIAGRERAVGREIRFGNTRLSCRIIACRNIDSATSSSTTGRKLGDPRSVRAICLRCSLMVADQLAERRAGCACHLSRWATRSLSRLCNSRRSRRPIYSFSCRSC